ncbi:hypothetical protein Avbf_13052 [Armadillidium vulgare]|nr:hypothetical protein Avbf_13052 [Armadillidium vulgare]
MICIYLLVAAR